MKFKSNVDITGNLDVSGSSTFGGVVNMPNSSRIKGSSTGDTNSAWLGFYESNGTVRQGYIGLGSISNRDVTLYNDTSASIFSSLGTGGFYFNQKVGIGGIPLSDMLRVTGSSTFDGNVTLSNGSLVITQSSGTETFKVTTPYDRVGKFISTDNTAFLAIQDNNSTDGGVGINVQGDSLQLVTANTAGLTLDSSSNVGIGTTSPNVQLHIGAAVNVAPKIRLELNDSGNSINAGQEYGGIQWEGNDGQGNGIRADIRVFGEGTSGESSLRFGTRGAGTTNSTEAIERMRIDSSGNVGIGTTNPGYKLDVSGTLNTTGAATFASSGIFGGAVQAGGSLTVRGSAPFITFKNSAGTPLGTIQHNESNLLIDPAVGITNIIGNISATGTITGSNLSGTNTGDQDLSGYALTSHSHTPESIGAARFVNNAYLNSSTTTADFITELTNDYGCFNNSQVTIKCAWSYAGNSNLNTGHPTIGTIELAGCTIETWGGTYKHVRITRPNTGTGGHGVYEYNDQGSGYSPGWREIWTSESDGAGSGLDADLLDGQHASAFAPVSHTHTWANINGETANSVNGWGGLRHQTNDGYIDFGPANSSHAHIYTDRPNFYLNKAITVNGQSIINTGDIRSNIFYDSNNTGYYLNPASTSNLNGLTVNGTITGNISGTASNSNQLGGLGSAAYMKDNGWNNYPGQDANTQPAMSSDFTYSNNAPLTGDLIRFGASNYSLQLNSQYGGTGNALSFRTKNGDTNTWNPWYSVYHSGNFNPSSYLTTSGKAADSNLLDGVDSTQFMRSDITDTFFSGQTSALAVENHGTFTRLAFNQLRFYEWDSGGDNLILNNGYVSSDSSFRAPIFYDSNNTSYYLNPASTSTVNKVNYINNAIPIVVKLNSEHKSWAHHVSASDDYVLVPSGTDGGEDWAWSSGFNFNSTGNITANNFILRSDERLKTKITDLPCDNIDAAWKSFELKSDKGNYRTGVIAQELEIKHPEFINTDNQGFKSVKYIDLLIAKIAELEARLEKLEK